MKSWKNVYDMSYVMFGIGDAAPRCFGVECHYFDSLIILPLMSYFIIVINNFTDKFMSMASPSELQI